MSAKALEPCEKMAVLFLVAFRALGSGARMA